MILKIVILCSFLLLCACADKVEPGLNTNTKYGAVSRIWGLPMTRLVTGGFNGGLTEPNLK
jgi:hypothetical protein